MKRVYIVTGANGFLGNNIIRKLAENKDNEIRALVLPQENTRPIEGLNCDIYLGDVTKPDSLNEIFNIDDSNAKLYVIHCAGIVYIKSKYNPIVYEVNVNGTKNIVAKVLEKNAKLVYVSSVHAIEEKPDREIITEIKDFDVDKVEGQYAKTKAEAAKYVLEMVENNGLDACIVHPSGMIGPNDFTNGHMTQLMVDVANRRLAACVNGGYDFADVRDVAEGIISACEKGKKGECYILSNRYIEVKELLDIVCEVSNIKKINIILPMWFAKLTAPLAELYYSILKQPPLFTKYSLYTLCSNSNFSNKKAQQELGYTNRDLKETVVDTIKWLKDQGRIK
ncbi:MAG: NAD-dependent epimerase/dehydratase family protein [Christensenellaceae bacterium]|nr:NAD-dependent epimerase/dehydratase family protein [Christensenellaceae bacterium]